MLPWFHFSIPRSFGGYNPLKKGPGLQRVHVDADSYIKDFMPWNKCERLPPHVLWHPLLMEYPVSNPAAGI